MIVVIQRVKEASVEVAGEIVSQIGKGMLLLVGVAREDTIDDCANLASKIAKFRMFEDEEGKMNISIKEIDGDVLSVSQFTLCADLSKGNRPSFDSAMLPENAEKLYKIFNEELSRQIEKEVKAGIFGAEMTVKILNDGPVTFVLKSK